MNAWRQTPHPKPGDTSHTPQTRSTDAETETQNLDAKAETQNQGGRRAASSKRVERHQAEAASRWLRPWVRIGLLRGYITEALAKSCHGLCARKCVCVCVFERTPR